MYTQMRESVEKVDFLGWTNSYRFLKTQIFISPITLSNVFQNFNVVVDSNWRGISMDPIKS